MNPRPPGHILAAMSDEPTRSPLEQGAGRLEAFSDAVMAVIITLLAFQLKVPDGVTRQAIDDAVPFLFLYVLCFVLIAIYWNNHHHLLRAADRISGAAMWANMALLFCLSLIPVATEWIGTARRDHLDPVSPAAFLGIVFLAAAISYGLLVRALIRANGRDSRLARAVHRDIKGNVSAALYAAGVVAAALLHNVYLAYGCYVVVGVIWLVPDRRFTHAHDDDGNHTA